MSDKVEGISAKVNEVLEELAEPNIKLQRAFKRRERIEWIANLCAERWDGDLCEIGAYRGETTAALLAVASKHKRRVIAIDLWENDEVFRAFQENTARHKKILIATRADSKSGEAIQILRDHPLCFASVDANHEYASCLGDIMAVRHCLGIIEVDDVRDLPKVQRAFFHSARLLDREPIERHGLGIREGYLIPREEKLVDGDPAS